MSKKNKVDLKTVESNIGRIGMFLANMVAAPGIKKQKGVSRAESAALSYGLSIGIGVGFELATSEKWRMMIFGTNNKPITKEEACETAARILSTAVDDFSEHREHMLGIKKNAPGVVTAIVECDDEVR